mgnify:CR=1 FL=1
MSLDAEKMVIMNYRQFFNLLTKIDLLDKKSKQQLDMFLDPSMPELLNSDHCGSRFNAK